MKQLFLILAVIFSISSIPALDPFTLTLDEEPTSSKVVEGTEIAQSSRKPTRLPKYSKLVTHIRRFESCLDGSSLGASQLNHSLSRLVSSRNGLGFPILV